MSHVSFLDQKLIELPDRFVNLSELYFGTQPETIKDDDVQKDCFM